MRVGKPQAWLRYDTSLASLVYLDRANLRPMPPRWLHHLAAGAQLGGGFELQLSARNLTDQRVAEVAVRGAPSGTGTAAVADFIGYPLPGRSYFASLVWRQS